MMNKFLEAFGLFLILILVACAPEKRTSGWVETAPQREDQVGVIVQFDDGAGNQRERVEKEIIAARGLAARALDDEGRSFEVYGVDREVLSAEFPEAEVIQNYYLPRMIPRSSGFSGQARKGFDITTGCNAPLTGAIVFILPGSEQFAGGSDIVLRNGRPLKFLSQVLNAPEKIRKIWLIEGPEGSRWNEQSQEGAEFTFLPDILGEYTVYLIVQDSLKRCVMQMKEFGLSFGANEDKTFKGKKPPRTMTEADFKSFSHLKKIKADQAWKQAQGQGVSIAIIDSGVNYNHPDLSSNLALDTDGKSPLGKDFVTGSRYPLDDEGHGTHVAGLAASAVSGVAKRAKIIPIKILNALGRTDLATLSAAIRYALESGAKVINTSLGMQLKNKEAETALLKVMNPLVALAKKKNVTWVLAAGNNGDGGINVDLVPFYPANLALPQSPQLLSVAAIAFSGSLAKYSNFGKKYIGLAAPGGSDEEGGLLSTYHATDQKKYVRLSGTSMASPLVAGAVALIRSRNPALTAAETGKILQGSGDLRAALKNKVRSGRSLNVLAAVLQAGKIKSVK